jgi:hypothetical protein
MIMSQLFVILRKDARRLWPAVLLGTAVLAALSALDGARADYIPSMEESLCNALLALLWCGLIVQVVHLEAPADANPFYATRPCSWPQILGAKLAFALFFIHLPLLLANSLVLALRSFSPWQHLSALLSLQLTVAVMLTLPSLALGSVTRTLGQAAWMAALLIAGSAVLRAYAWPVQFPWAFIDTDSLIAALVWLTLASAVLLGLQYARRRTALSRAIGLAALFLAGSTFLYLPRELTASWRASAPGAMRVDLRPSESGEFNPSQYIRPGIRSLSVPLKLSGSRADTQFTTEILKLELTSTQGLSWKFDPRAKPSPIPKPLQAGIWVRDDGQGFLSLTMLPPSFETLKATRINLSGKLAVNEYEKALASQAPVSGSALEVSEIGRCGSLLTASPYYPDGSEMLKVLCESPEPLPRRVDVLLSSQGGAKPWRHFLGDSDSYVAYPRITWLSPLHRKQTFFHVKPGVATLSGAEYLVPKAALEGATLTFLPWRESRRLVLPLSFSNLSLKEGLVRE